MTAAPNLAGLVDAATLTEGGEPRTRTRKRPPPIRLSESDRYLIVDRVKRFAQSCEDDRRGEKELRAQRYAKLMMWTEPVNWPWPDASNVALPDLMSVTLRFENTLCNSMLSTRPVIGAQALDRQNREKERQLDLLHDQQFFVEQPGEKIIEQAAMDFVRDGTLTLYVRWIAERRRVQQVHTFEPMELGEVPQDVFARIMEQQFRTKDFMPLDPEEPEPWEYALRDEDGNDLEIRFYTSEDERVEMEVRGEVKTFDGPRVMAMPYENVLHPYWCMNLQPPSPSNPQGAPWVILVDEPTLDEIAHGIESGFYDLVSMKDIEGRDGESRASRDPETMLDRQRDELRGFNATRSSPEWAARNHSTTTRYTCFDVWSDDGEGPGLDVVWWVLPEFDLLLRARPLSEMVPGSPPRRPFGESALFPVQGRRIGMSLPELAEGLHDWKSHTVNQTVDATDLEIQPFGTYRTNAQINPEVYRVFPGAMLPRDQPDDVRWDRIPPQSAQIGLNMLTVIDQMEEKLTQVGDLQLGRIPAGKSAALRTSGGINQLLAQGEAQPERILRRFFCAWREAWQIMFTLNRTFLDDRKRFRTTLARPEEDPFIEARRADLSGAYQFDFAANILNASKTALQASLGEVLTLAMNPLMLQMQIVDAEGVYRLLQDYLRALGQQPEKYLRAPVPDAGEPRISAPAAMRAILAGQMPVGVPEEGSETHLAKMQELLQLPASDGTPLAETLEPVHQQLLGAYLGQLQQRIAAAQQQASMLQAAQQGFTARAQSQGQAPGPQPPGGSAAPTLAQVAPGDVMNESLPASGTPQ